MEELDRISLIYDEDIHAYLINRYNECLKIRKVHFGQLMNELNFVKESFYLSNRPYPHYVQVQFPELSDDWICNEFSYEKLGELLDKNINPKINYSYSFFFIHENIKSLILNWLMSAKDLRMKSLVSTIISQLTDTLSFISQNCSNTNSLNLYLDIWNETIENIAKNDNSYWINGIRFGEYLNQDEVYEVQALFSANKR